MSKSDLILTTDEALAMLPDGDYVHTFRGQHIPVGADWLREDIIKALRENQVELSGPITTGMGYGMCFCDKYGWVFVATRPPKGEASHDEETG